MAAVGLCLGPRRAGLAQTSCVVASRGLLGRVPHKTDQIQGLLWLLAEKLGGEIIIVPKAPIFRGMFLGDWSPVMKILVGCVLPSHVCPPFQVTESWISSGELDPLAFIAHGYVTL